VKKFCHLISLLSFILQCQAHAGPPSTKELEGREIRSRLTPHGTVIVAACMKSYPSDCIKAGKKWEYTKEELQAPNSPLLIMLTITAGAAASFAFLAFFLGAESPIAIGVGALIGVLAGVPMAKQAVADAKAIDKALKDLALPSGGVPLNAVVQGLIKVDKDTNLSTGIRELPENAFASDQRELASGSAR
jgi:hypothetical protein